MRHSGVPTTQVFPKGGPVLFLYNDGLKWAIFSQCGAGHAVVRQLEINEIGIGWFVTVLCVKFSKLQNNASLVGLGWWLFQLCPKISEKQPMKLHFPHLDGHQGQPKWWNARLMTTCAWNGIDRMQPWFKYFTKSSTMRRWLNHPPTV